MKVEDQRILDSARDLFAGLSDRYELETLLGVGGMGLVAKVRHKGLGVSHALKSLHLHLQRFASIRKRFLNEARTMAMLHSPHIVQVHDVGEVGGWPYMIMEFLEGGTILDHMEVYGALAPRQAVQVTIDVLKGLSVAHSKGVVHRDIKPENIIMTASGVIKVADFGIAKIEEGTSHTRADSTMGSYLYMAPEQADAKSADARADLFATAVALWGMLACDEVELVRLMETKLFFSDLLSSRPELLEMIPGELQSFVLKACCEDPEDRHQTAEEMIEELQSVLRGLPEDPEDTPRLGTAPQVLCEAEEAIGSNLAAGSSEADELAAVAQDSGGTIVPGVTRAMDGAQSSASGALASHVSEVPELRSRSRLPPPGFTQDEEQRPRELPFGTMVEAGRPISETKLGQMEDELRSGAVRKIGIVAAVLLLFGVGVGVVIWQARTPEPEVIVQPAPEQTPEQVEEPAMADLSPPEEITPEEIEEITPEPVQETTPEPVRTKAKTKVRTPTPPPEPEATAAPVTATVSVQFSGVPDASADPEASGKLAYRLVGTDGQGSFTLTPGSASAQIPAGTYKATFDGRKPGQPVRSITVEAGGNTTVSCDWAFSNCRSR